MTTTQDVPHKNKPWRRSVSVSQDTINSTSQYMSLLPPPTTYHTKTSLGGDPCLCLRTQSTVHHSTCHCDHHHHVPHKNKPWRRSVSVSQDTINSTCHCDHHPPRTTQKQALEEIRLCLRTHKRSPRLGQQKAAYKESRLEHRRLE